VKYLPANALRRQLGKAQSAGPHPDSDQLTAFAEDGLLDRERADLLAHLASCPSCRAVLHAASAAEPEAAAIPQLLPARKPRRIWIPGIAVAASLLVIAASSILLYRATRTSPAGPPIVASAPPPAASVSQPPASAPAPPSATPLEPRAKAPAPKPARTPVHPQVPAPMPQSTESVEVSSAPAPLTTTQGDTSAYSLGMIATRGAPAPTNQQQVQAEVIQQRNALAAAKPTPGAAQVQEQRAFSGEFRQSLHGVFMARPAVRPLFRINDEGQIERSTDAGLWQPVPVGTPVHFRVLSVSGADIWAGGDRLRLFHSQDNGATWVEVQPPIGADRTHAIIHIRIESPQKLAVESDDGTTWSTIDGGVTWQ
jgi:Putative zinc-finger